jgi:hypothetical protein
MPTPNRRWRNLLLLALVAALSFGGSFTCKGSTNDDGDDNFGGSVDVR